jgi:hypothetical protein
MSARLEAQVSLSDELTEALQQAGTIVGRGTLAAASGFLWIDNADVRDMLLATPASAELFVDPSPPAGLLVGAGVDPERLLRRCRALGVDVSVEEGLMRVRQATIPPPKKSDTRKAVSWRPPAPRRKRGTGTS